MSYNRFMAQEQIRLFSVAEYHKMGEAGILPEKRVELIGGVIRNMSPMRSPHAAITSRLMRLFFYKLPEQSAHIRVQSPIALDDLTEPEPDLAVVRNSDDDYHNSHPRPEDIFLVVEVSDSTLQVDRKIKLPRYAEGKIPELWIVNLPEETLEIYRNPVPLGGEKYGYKTMTIYRSGDEVDLLKFPEIKIPVHQIL